MKIKKFEDLKIWQQSLKATKVIYDLTAKKEFAKDFGLRDQIRRSIISVSSNIVEGFEKNNNNEFIRFFKIAKGSVGEARNQLYIAHTVGYISDDEFEKTNKLLIDIANQIGSFITYLSENKKQYLARQKAKK